MNISRRMAALVLAAPAAMGLAVEPPPSLPDGTTTRVIWRASGVRSGGGLTTVVTCSNHGSVAGTIGVAYYEFDASLACSSSFFGVAAGASRTFAIDPVASMSGVASCLGSPTVGQGRLEVFADPAQTLKFTCSAMLVDKAANPPPGLTRLSLYTGSGGLAGEVIFTDSFDP